MTCEIIVEVDRINCKAWNSDDERISHHEELRVLTDREYGNIITRNFFVIGDLRKISVIYSYSTETQTVPSADEPTGTHSIGSNLWSGSDGGSHGHVR